MAKGLRLAGSKAVLTLQKKGVLLQNGDTLKAKNWFEVKSKAATGSVLPNKIPTQYAFKTGTADLTLANGDEVYALQFLKICKVNCNISLEKGSVEVTTDCDNGFNTYISDGYRNVSGDFSGFFEFDVENPNGMFEAQKHLLDDFYDSIKDDGKGAYAFESAKDTIFRLWILRNSETKTQGHYNVFLSVPIILTSQSAGMELKSGQSFDNSFQKGIGPIYQYIRKIDDSHPFDWENLDKDPIDGGNTSDDYTDV